MGYLRMDAPAELLDSTSESVQLINDFLRATRRVRAEEDLVLKFEVMV
jgi:hypothetical protein